MGSCIALFVQYLCKLSHLRKVGLEKQIGTQIFKMTSKVLLLFLLIAGVFAVNLIAEAYDIEARDIDDDLTMLDSDGMEEVHSFCDNPEHSDDPFCQAVNHARR